MTCAGVGRVSAVRFPRLGGVLHGRIAPATRAAALLTGGAERTIRAGYQAAVATHQVADVRVERADADELWDAFLPVSYRIPRSVAAAAWEVCRFDVFWVELLTELGLDGDANRFGNGHVSPLSRSIRGLSTVGVALALAERGGAPRSPRLGPPGGPQRATRRAGPCPRRRGPSATSSTDPGRPRRRRSGRRGRRQSPDGAADVSHRGGDALLASAPPAASPRTTPRTSAASRFWLSLRLASTRDTSSSMPTIARSIRAT